MRPGPLLTGLSLPRDLELLRDRASEASRRGEDLAPLYEELAETAPVALIDLTLGPKAMREAAAVRAALAHADALERHSPGMAPYRRLASLSPEAALDVLTVAVARHAAASWLIPFADKIEARPGAMQLARLGPVQANEFFVRLHPRDGVELTVFADARAIIRGVETEGEARALYDHYVGS